MIIGNYSFSRKKQKKPKQIRFHLTRRDLPVRLLLSLLTFLMQKNIIRVVEKLQILLIKIKPDNRFIWKNNKDPSNRHHPLKSEKFHLPNLHDLHRLAHQHHRIHLILPSIMTCPICASLIILILLKTKHLHKRIMLSIKRKLLLHHRCKKQIRIQ